MVKCLICDKELISLKALSQHIRFHNISSKDYYDRFLIIDEKEKHCKYCGKETNFRNISLGYQNFCNLKCSNNDEERKEKFRQSYLSNDLSIVKETREQTNLKRYGYKSVLENKIIRNKGKQTILEKYGVNFPIQNAEIKERTKQTNLEKYGVQNPMQNLFIKEKPVKCHSIN